MINFAAVAITRSAPRMRSKGFQTTSADSSPRSEVHRDVKQALMTCGIFGKTDPDVVSALAESLQPLCFPPRHVVFAQGDLGNCLFLVVSGKVKLTYSRGDGRDVVINVAGPRDVFGEVTAFDRGPRESTAITVTEVRAIAVECDQLMAWAIAYPEIAHQIMRLLARRVDVMTSCLVDFAFAPPAHRIANRLLLLRKRFGVREGDVLRVRHDLTLDEISQFAGVNPESIGLTMIEFEDCGWIRFEDDWLEILDSQSLAAFAAGQGPLETDGG